MMTEKTTRRHGHATSGRVGEWESGRRSNAPSPTRPLALSLLLLAASGLVRASGTVAWEMNTYSDFIRGRFQGVSLTRDGHLTLAPRLDPVFNSDQQVIWSVARGVDGSVYAGTGNRGRVYRIDPGGQGTILWTANEPEVFALAVEAGGALYAGSSPDGKVYRIVNGKATEYFNPKAKYIWSLAVAADGTLYVGTGDQGKVYRVTAAGQGDVYYETGQSHVTSLAVDAQGRLLAGTEPNGILYRITARDKAFALYDANLPEIRAIVPAKGGAIYAAALGGSMAKRMQTATQAGQTAAGSPAVTATSTSITVEASAQAGDLKLPDAKQQQAAAATPQVTSTVSTGMDLMGVEKSAVYRINPDNTVDTLWSSKEENVYDVLETPEGLLFATDGNGRVYSLSPDRKAALVAQTNEAEATRLLAARGGVLAATGNLGRIYKLGAPSASGSYESPVYDAGTTARWGTISWRGETPGSAKLAFQVRTGNSSRPDRSWSDWSGAISTSGMRIPSPNARFIQWRVELAGAQTPAIDNVTVAYLPQNSPPVIRAITVTNAPSAAAAKPAAQQQPTSAYTVTVTDTGDASSSTTAGTPSTTLTRSVGQQINITWQAEDPEGDRMVYTVWFRGDGEREWKVLKSNLRENMLALDGDALADGRYFFRVLASDGEVNPPSMAHTAELVSTPVVIDNTPPTVTIGSAQRNGANVKVTVEAMDAASPLRRCEYSLDAAPWVPLEAADGVVDSAREQFVVSLANVPAGEHLLVVRAVDSSNNSGLAKTVLR